MEQSFPSIKHPILTKVPRKFPTEIDRLQQHHQELPLILQEKTTRAFKNGH